ncbi:proline and serine-rich protein 2-like [Megalops cyprinoides]|uniref:proline and serine-rich protein 2-like n=1 Tax=Megalops cyprinoides TaxID=118141 RepID=UPI001864D488|nr:proline and serine-rich protein 2-like [Megalops cyprinoides]XP_036375667.1 proline and serine-rich protein 2-like [Megalops cyprinoides]
MMDFQVPPEPGLHYGANGSQEGSRRNSQNLNRPSEDEALRFLSREEMECILFFDETIESLDDNAEDLDQTLSSASSTPVEDSPATPSPVPTPHRTPSPKEQDIIDLVRTQPVPVEPREVQFNPTMPDFRSMAVNPETHFEMKARRDPMENFPSEYHFPSPPNPSVLNEEGPSPSHAQYHPAGSVPTPVLIAQKIAEHQGGGCPLLPSALLLGRRRSLEISTPPPDYPIKQGPPTMAKPTRYPDNISLMMAQRDHSHAGAKVSTDTHDRKAWVLANLAAGPRSPESKRAPARNIPTRSVSFRDPAPEKSRMEALSKLGLTRDRTFSSNFGSRSRVINPSLLSRTKTEPLNRPAHLGSKEVLSTIQAEGSASEFNSYGGKSKVVTPSCLTAAKTDTSTRRASNEDTASSIAPPASHTDSTSSNFNNNAERSKVETTSPTTAAKVDTSTHHMSNDHLAPSAPPNLSHTDSASNDFNSYGGKTKTMTTSPAEKYEPSSHLTSICEGRTSTVPPAIGSAATQMEVDTSEFNSYGGKSKVVTPARALTAQTEPTADSSISHDNASKAATASPSPGPKADAAPKDVNNHSNNTTAVTSSLSKPGVSVTGGSARLTATTPRPSHPEGSLGSQVATTVPAFLEVRRRSVSKPAFFHQGITVQFSGRGATDESRREALRKLGLLRDTP